jgi:hypothetical protein
MLCHIDQSQDRVEISWGLTLQRGDPSATSQLSSGSSELELVA